MKVLTNGIEESRKITPMNGSSEQRVLARPGSPATWRTSGHEAQVFVDDSGRRALGVRLACFAIAALCAVWLTGLVVGMVGFSGFATPRLAALAQGSVTHRTSAPLALADVEETGSASSIGRARYQPIAARPACASYRIGAGTPPGRRKTALHSACLIQLAAADRHRDVASA
jgi:hypothetical protein